MSHFSRTAVITAACLVILAPGAHAQTKGQTAFGTMKKIDTKGQRIMVTEYNWESLEIEDTTYIYNVRTIELFNADDINAFKPGDEIEFEWSMNGNRKLISKLSKGSMPIEEIDLLWDPNMLPDDVDAGDAPPLPDAPAVEPDGSAAPTAPDTGMETAPEDAGDMPAAPDDGAPVEDSSAMDDVMVDDMGTGMDAGMDDAAEPDMPAEVESPAEPDTAAETP